MAQKSEARWGDKRQRCRVTVQNGLRPVQKCKGKARFQSTECRVQSAEGTGWQGNAGAWGRRNRGADGQGQRAQVNRAGWVNGYSWHAKPAHHPSPPSIQTPVALSSAVAVVITLRVIAVGEHVP